MTGCRWRRRRYGSVSWKSTLRTIQVTDLVDRLDVTGFYERHEGGGRSNKPCMVRPAHVAV